MPYTLTLAGETFRSDDITLDEAVAFEGATGQSWRYLNPHRSAEQFRAVALIFLRRTREMPEAEAILAKMSLRDALAAVVEVDEDLPDEYEDGLPKAADAASTPTS